MRWIILAVRHRSSCKLGKEVTAQSLRSGFVLPKANKVLVRYVIVSLLGHTYDCLR